ncbi:DNA-binding protein [Bacillus cereus group sp. RP43]|uniref:DNA-binding protein n=1 Tax=Bacillus cereus group sp. RP43 TaxID=3040260 RepID=UPI003393BF45
MSFISKTSEAMEVMNMNRSRLKVLVKNGRIIPLKRTKNMRFFLKSDAEQLGKELAVLRKKYRPFE